MFPQTGAYFVGTGCATDGSDFSASPPPSCGCTPSCGGKQCGDDGCGSVCGTCDATATCTANQCVPNSTGGTNDGGFNPDPDPVDVTATGCSCNVGQSTGPAAAQLTAATLLLGLALLRRSRKNPV